MSMSTTEDLEHLFSYGTLQNEAVQLATFGRKLVGEPDTLLGYRQTLLEIHLNVQFTGRDSDFVVSEYHRAKHYADRARVYGRWRDAGEIRVS